MTWRTGGPPSGRRAFCRRSASGWAAQLTPRTLIDVVRRLHPDIDGPYSWWSWLGQAYERDAGWRIDYHLATPALARAAVHAAVDREHRGIRLSDHAPVIVDYDL